jgi:hypothetical protein
LQRVCSSTISVFSTQQMLFAVGLGAKRTLPAAAALNWVLKDGLGRLGKLTVATKFGRRFDADMKRFRFTSSLYVCRRAPVLKSVSQQWIFMRVHLPKYEAPPFRLVHARSTNLLLIGMWMSDSVLFIFARMRFGGPSMPGSFFGPELRRADLGLSLPTPDFSEPTRTIGCVMLIGLTRNQPATKLLRRQSYPTAQQQEQQQQ